MISKSVLLITVVVTLVSGQRPPFAGSRPIGFPEIIRTTTEGLGNRFGEDDVSTTTVRLPLEAMGDRDLVDRLSKLPVDQQPFWLINWHALEEHRKNPQTFPQKPNVFIESMQQQQQQQASQQQALQQQALQQQALQQQSFQQQASQQSFQQQAFRPQSSQQFTQNRFGLPEQEQQQNNNWQYYDSSRRWSNMNQMNNGFGSNNGNRRTVNGESGRY